MSALCSHGRLSGFIRTGSSYLWLSDAPMLRQAAAEAAEVAGDAQSPSERRMAVLVQIQRKHVALKCVLLKEQGSGVSSQHTRACRPIQSERPASPAKRQPGSAANKPAFDTEFDSEK